jgi:hypothetical protein
VPPDARPPFTTDKVVPSTSRSAGGVNCIGGYTTWGLDALAVLQPPLVVSVSVAVPSKPAGAVHVAFKSVGEGLKVPVGELDQVPDVADPPTEPPRGIVVPPR